MSKIIEITTNLNQTLNLDSSTAVVVFRDTFLSGWGGAQGVNHYGIILANESATGAAYKLQHYATYKDKTIKNIRVMKLKDVFKLSSISFLNGFPVADIEPMKA